VGDWLANSSRNLDGLGSWTRLRLELAEQADNYAAKATKLRMFGDFEYTAGTCGELRRVIARLEHSEQGVNFRFIVSELPGSA